LVVPLNHVKQNSNLPKARAAKWSACTNVALEKEGAHIISG
jgi:hypothetical protein